MSGTAQTAGPTQGTILKSTISHDFAGGDNNTFQAGDSRKTHKYIIVFKTVDIAGNKSLQQEVDSLSSSLSAQYQATVEHKWGKALNGMVAELTQENAARLEKDPRVALIEEDQPVYINATQTPATWGPDRVDQRNLPLDNSYSYTLNGAGVTAYIIDTGILTTHDEFGGRASWGADFVDGANTDCHGHGTHVAGIVGGATYGIAKGVSLVAVKVMDCGGAGTVSGVLSGIDWVVANKRLPAVVNLSLGSGYSAALNQAVANAIAAGIVVVAAAGNSNADACTVSPASSPNAITVGATTSTDAKASFSNWGACLDIFAPGSAILSSYIGSNNAIITASGTSMATPHVAGAVALALNQAPGATPAVIADQIINNATPNLVTNPVAGSPNKLLYIGEFNTKMLTVAKLGLGLITSAPAGINCGGVCNADFNSGQVVALTATPEAGSVFSNWSGDCSGLNANCTVTMNANQSVTAHFAPAGTLTGLFAAVLPYARSVQVGQTATAFGTMINTTGVDVTNCTVALPGSPAIPASLNFQTTNANNQLEGTLNTPISILAGGSQSFVFGITPTAAFNATDIPIVFDCGNTQPAPSQTGLNTFLLSAATSAPPDLIAIGATSSQDGILRIPSPTGVHAFGTAVVNIGASGVITATADTGGVNLPLTLTLCQTNPTTGTCLALPAAAISGTVNTNQSVTYAVFARASGAIALNPAVNRIFLKLSASGVVRGATSLAVMTESP